MANNKPLLFLSLVVILNFTDFMLTVYGIVTGTAAEGNPIMQSGIGIIIKLIIVPVMLGVIYWKFMTLQITNDPKISNIYYTAMFAMIVMYAIIIVNNIMVIFFSYGGLTWG